MILLIDELNVIPTTCRNYIEMSEMLDEHVGRKGCALLYSTHHRIAENLLQGRTEGSAAALSVRSHVWVNIPRINSPKNLETNGPFQFSFWSTMLRGRIPALVCLSDVDVAEFIPQEDHMFTERQVALGAVLTGNADGLRPGRELFRSYCYNVSDRR